MSYASLFGGGPIPSPAPSHTFETDAPDPPEKAQEAKGPASWPDAFVDIDGLQVPDTETVNKWASYMHRAHGAQVRQITSVGHPVNKYGGWVFEEWRSSSEGGGKGGYARLRYADALQMQEIYEALHSATEFWALVNCTDIDGNPIKLPGPFREGKPPTDAKGLPWEEQPSRGEHGPLRAECEWMEAHDDVIVEYLGTDPQWPNGCWQVDKRGCPLQYLDLAGIKYVAHNILGMPTTPTVRKLAQPRKPMWNSAKDLAQANGSGFASLFADDEPEEREAHYPNNPTNSGFASLFT